MRRVAALVKKEFRQIRRTKAYFALIFIAPFMQLLIMGSAITNEVKDIPLVITDLDMTPSSREIFRRFNAVSLFRFQGETYSVAEAIESLDNGTAKAAIVIPNGFERDREGNTSPALQVLIDGMDGNSAGISLAYINSTLGIIQRGWVESLRMKNPPVQGGKGVTEVIPRFYYNPDLDSSLNFVPGLIGILLFMITTMLTATNIVKEKEQGTLEQLMVTPLGGNQLILGKIIPFTVLGLLQFTIGIIAARLIFGIPIVGSLPLLYGMALLFIMSTLGMGIFISTITTTQQQAMFVAWFSLIFALLLSGFFVPIKNMPIFIQHLTRINPLRYFISVLREIYLKGAGLPELRNEAAAMGLIGMLFLTAASLKFHKRLS